MKKYDVLDIAIKILGLSLVPNAVFWIGQSSVLVPASTIYNDIYNMDFYTFLSYVVATLFYICPIFLFVFKTKWLLTKILKLNNDEPSTDIAMRRSSFIEIALVIIGGITLINSLPDFLTQTVQKVQIRKMGIYVAEGSFSNSWIYRDGSEIILAIIFIVYAKPIAGYFAKRADRSEKIISPNE